MTRKAAQGPARRGWFVSHRWLLLRRLSQLCVLGIFLSGPWFGLWIAKGNLSSSLMLGSIPLTDPYLLVQSLAARHWPSSPEWIGAALLVVFYSLVGGRVFCSWVCPVNPITDAAAWLRRRLGLRSSATLPRATRYWILVMTLVVAAATGSIAWELVNPVSMIQRALIFNGSFGWILAALFLLDLFFVQHGWCGHLCPVGAFYAVIGRWSWLRIGAVGRNACNDCAKCFVVCPEPLVIKPALKAVEGAGPVIKSGSCTNCGRCIDVCAQNVFKLGSRRRTAPSLISFQIGKH